MQYSCCLGLVSHIHIYMAHAKWYLIGLLGCSIGQWGSFSLDSLPNVKRAAMLDNMILLYSKLVYLTL